MRGNLKKWDHYVNWSVYDQFYDNNFEKGDSWLSDATRLTQFIELFSLQLFCSKIPDRVVSERTI